MVEAMIKPSSACFLNLWKKLIFRGRFNLTVVALHRKGKNLHLRLNQLKLEIGDTLLLLGSKSSVESLRGSREAVLLDKAPLNVVKKPTKAAFSVCGLLAIVTVASFGFILYIASLLVAGFLILSNTVNLREAVRAVE